MSDPVPELPDSAPEGEISDAPVARYLLPDNVSTDAEGRMSVGGVDLVELAEEFGTPLFVYDEEHLRARCREAVAAFGSGVAFATKAFLCVAMAKLAYEEGMHLDVASGGELHVAKAAGVPGTHLVLHGNNKSGRELREAIEYGVARIVVDSFDELDRLEAIYAKSLTEKRTTIPKVLLRVTPGVEAHTHEFISTGQNDSKFGFTVSTGVAAQAVERAQKSPAVELVGLHAHIGSQVFRAESFRESARVMADFAAPFGLPELSLGGGLGVPYVAGEEAPTITQWGAMVRAAAQEAGITAKLLAEPGRSIVAAAGITLYEAGTIKHLEGIRTYIAVDGGMSDNPRPVLYGSGYEMFLPRALDAERPLRARLVGKHCESGDILVREGGLPADTAVGDIIATPVTGAYGHSLASNYNKLPRPAVVFAHDGDARTVVRRETYEDLIRLDL